MASGADQRSAARTEAFRFAQAVRGVIHLDAGGISGRAVIEEHVRGERLAGIVREDAAFRLAQEGRQRMAGRL
jgi:hypothetical protein